MTNIPESIVNLPQTLEQRIETIEGNFGQILDVLKTLVPNKDITNGYPNDNDNGASGGGPSIQTMARIRLRLWLLQKHLALMRRLRMQFSRPTHYLFFIGQVEEARIPKRKETSMWLALATINPKPPHHPSYHSSPHSMSPFRLYPYPSYPQNYLNPYSVGSSIFPQANNISFPNNKPYTQNQFDQPKKGKVRIDHVPMSYSEIYDALLKGNLVAPDVPQPVSDPPPKWYNPVRCASITWEYRDIQLRNVGLSKHVYKN
ncbi:hypothetical protein SESBI_40866 [Sesbania bispinosa]|nr:hypothetical protein SESBI_40866 [Sesbania bispinosa]